MQQELINQLVPVVKGVVSEAVAEAIDNARAQHFLNPEEREWVRMAIKREARQEAFREKVISSTAIGALWALLAGIGGAILLAAKEYMISHGMWRP